MAKRTPNHTKSNQTKKPRDLYQEVTDTILEHLDRGVAPWRQPIRAGGGLPTSLGSGRPYRGVNTFLLAMVAWAKGFQSNHWLTFNQSKKLGGSVRKGEKGTLVVFWKTHATEDRETGEAKTHPVLRHYNVFNADQVEGIKPPDADAQAEPFEPIEAAERIAAGFPNGPTVLHGSGVAYYKPTLDVVCLPEPSRFDPPESYYATLYHEFSHATGIRSRLNRGLDADPAPFGSRDYSKEELVAEMGSAFLCAAAGIGPATIEQSAAYLDGWRRKLKDDKRLVIQAAGLGQRAADHVLGVSFEEAAATTNTPSERADPKPAPGPDG